MTGQRPCTWSRRCCRSRTPSPACRVHSRRRAAAMGSRASPPTPRPVPPATAPSSSTPQPRLRMWMHPQARPQPTFHPPPAAPPHSWTSWSTLTILIIRTLAMSSPAAPSSSGAPLQRAVAFSPQMYLHVISVEHPFFCCPSDPSRVVVDSTLPVPLGLRGFWCLRKQKSALSAIPDDPTTKDTSNVRRVADVVKISQYVV